MIKRTKILSIVTDTYMYFWTHLRLMRFFVIALIPATLTTLGINDIGGLVHGLIVVLYTSMLVMLIRHIVLEKRCTFNNVMIQLRSGFFWRFFAAIFLSIALAAVYLLLCMWLLTLAFEMIVVTSVSHNLTALFGAAVLLGLSLSCMVFFLFYVVSYIAIVTTNIAVSRSHSFHMANYHMVYHLHHNLL